MADSARQRRRLRSLIRRVARLEQGLLTAQQHIKVVEGQNRSLWRQLHNNAELLDVVSSPIYKRVWFWLCGWRWNRLGRWYAKDRWKG